jgi:hypothetical protein
MSIDIRLINGPDELQAVLQLRRRIYGEELGYDLPLAPAGQPLAGEALDLTGHLFGAFEGTRLVGAVRVNYASVDPGRAGDGFGTYADFYGMRRFGPAYPQGISIVTRLMAEPEHRSGQTMARFGVALYEHTRDTQPQVDFCIIDCVPALKPLFLRIGYRQIGPVLQHPVAGPVLPLAFAVYHREHFARVGSPLAAVCPRHDRATAEWFDAKFAGEVQPRAPAAAAGTSIR